MIFEAAFGQAALTYALSATLTIIVCHKLRLDTGITVATLTAVAMIPETHGHYMDSFFIRLGTTLIGIAVASLINFFILPPNFYKKISESLPRLFRETGALLELLTAQISQGKKPSLLPYEKLNKDLQRTFRLVHYQREEWRYHRRSLHEIRKFHLIEKKLNHLQKAIHHIGNLQYMNIQKLRFTKEGAKTVAEAGSSIATAFKNLNEGMVSDHSDQIERLEKLFDQLEATDKNRLAPHRHHFSKKTVLVYELLAIHDILEELQDIL